jgi:hypothetical protein
MFNRNVLVTIQPITSLRAVGVAMTESMAFYLNKYLTLTIPRNPMLSQTLAVTIQVGVHLARHHSGESRNLI